MGPPFDVVLYALSLLKNYKT